MSDAWLDALGAVLGRPGLLTEAADIGPYCEDWRRLFHGRARAVLRPADTGQAAAAMHICTEHRVPVVPQGGNTSLVGGAVPDDSGAQVVLSLSRMARVRAIDALDMTMEVEAGVTLAAAQAAADEAGCKLPLSINSEGTAQIGGVLSTNAGGNNTVRYGNARDMVLGIEAVLADGSVLHGLRRLHKDNTGYALRHLLVGSEGTLGIITAAVLKLQPRLAEIEVALCALPDAAAALALYGRLRAQDAGALQAFEYMAASGMELVLRHIPGAALPFAPAPHYALVEVGSTRAGSGVRHRLEAALAEAMEADEVTDAVIAESGAQRAALWKLREEHAEAQKREGASVKNDVSVPVSKTPELIRRASEACRALIPGIRPVPFGHMGDGNIHINLQQPEGMDPDAFLARSEELMATVNAVVRDLDGSFSAEHGVGRLKPAMLAEWRGGAELAAMQRIKAALDPHGLLNPGKVLPG